MAKPSLKNLKERIDKENNKNKNNSGGLFYPFWNLPDGGGKTKVRLLLDGNDDNDDLLYQEVFEHSFHLDGKTIKVPCLYKNWGETCPVCEVSQKYYKANEKPKGKYYYRKRYAIAQGIITKDGIEYSSDDEEGSKEGKHVYLRFTHQLLNKLKAEIGKLAEEEEDAEPWDLDKGIDFEIIKYMEGEFADYTNSGFARRSKPIPDDWRDIEHTDLSTLIPQKMSEEDINELLEKHFKEQNGESTGSDSDDSEDNIADENDIMEQINRSRNKKPSAEDEKKEDEESSEEDNGDDLPWDNDDSNDDSEDEDEEDSDILSEILDRSDDDSNDD